MHTVDPRYMMEDRIMSMQTDNHDIARQLTMGMQKD